MREELFGNTDIVTKEETAKHRMNKFLKKHQMLHASIKNAGAKEAARKAVCKPHVAKKPGKFNYVPTFSELHKVIFRAAIHQDGPIRLELKANALKGMM